MVSWEYIAGFFDGEGSILIDDKGSSLPVVKLNISQAERYPLEEIAKVAGGHVSDEKNGAVYMLWISRADEIIKFLEGIKPFSLRRQNRAEVALVIAKLTGSVRPQDKMLRIRLCEKVKEVVNG